MIKDAQGRKWFMRFKQYRNGWHWTARHDDFGQEAGRTFPTKAEAVADAERTIQSHDAIAQGKEYFRRLAERGSERRLTPEDYEAIWQAGTKRHA